MIFVTVGAQMPFDRMVRAVDEWAGRRGRTDVFAQIGPHAWEPRHIAYSQFLEPEAFRAKVEEASLVVAHAGMGSIITALELGKPIIIMPRRGDLKETRNDHQLATAREFQAQRRVVVAFDEGELSARMDELDGVSATERISSRASGELTESLRAFVERGVLPGGGGSGFDGVICFGASGGGEEVGLMREFARTMPVLLVESGRVESSAAGRLGRAARAIRGLWQGLERLGPNLVAMRLGDAAEAGADGVRARQASRVRAVAKRLGMRAPLAWVSEPASVEVVDRVPHAGLVYHVTGVDAGTGSNRSRHRTLRHEADLTVVSGGEVAAEGVDGDTVRMLAAGGERGAADAAAAVLAALSRRGMTPAVVEAARTEAARTVEGTESRSWTPAARPAGVGGEISAGASKESQGCAWGGSEPGLAVEALDELLAAGDVTGGAGLQRSVPGRRLIRPRAVVVLGGMVRPTPFSTAIGRSLFDLPLQEGMSVLDAWHAEAGELARVGGAGGELEVRVLVDQSTPLPAGPSASKVRVQRDALELRGTGGLLRDVAAEYADDEYLVVVGGVQILLRPLADVVAELSLAGGDVMVGSHGDRTPSPIMLCRCGALRLICDRGFVDMKEQALPMIAREHRVRVREGMSVTAMAVKTQSQYVAALRARFLHGGAGGPGSAFAEDWRRRFAVVEYGAEVDSSAIIHDSVVLRGGVVRAGAAVVQSVVCGVVGRNAVVTDALVAPAGGGVAASASAGRVS